MAYYDYLEGKRRIVQILDNTLTVVEKDKIPQGESFTFTNAYYGWVTGVFIDIRDSSSIFVKENKEEVSKMIRSFTSEVIEVLRDDDNLREIGIRGDCVYAIYTTSKQSDVSEIMDKCFWINTFMKMLNKLLTDRGFTTIKVGIGVSTDKELVVKAGRKGVDINNNVWIGAAVTKASNLSSYGNKNLYNAIVISSLTYENFIDAFVENNGEDSRGWFTFHRDEKSGEFYDSNVIKTDFNKWIDNGMK